MYILHRGDVEVIIGGTRVCKLSDGAVFGEIAAPWLAYGKGDAEADNYVSNNKNAAKSHFMQQRLVI